MTKEIEYYVKDVYGVSLAYIKDVELALLIQTLTGKKTIGGTHMNALKGLGFRFIQVLPPTR